MPRTPTRRVRAALFPLVLVASLACLGACEERVVGAKGLGANQYDIQEPLYQPTEWEQAIMGDPKPKKRDLVQPPAER